MPYHDKVALVLAAAIVAALVWDLRRPRPQRQQAWRAMMDHPHRPRSQWPFRPYDWERDGR